MGEVDLDSVGEGVIAAVEVVVATAPVEPLEAVVTLAVGVLHAAPPVQQGAVEFVSQYLHLAKALPRPRYYYVMAGIYDIN